MKSVHSCREETLWQTFFPTSCSRCIFKNSDSFDIGFAISCDCMRSHAIACDRMRSHAIACDRMRSLRHRSQKIEFDQRIVPMISFSLRRAIAQLPFDLARVRIQEKNTIHKMFLIKKLTFDLMNFLKLSVHVFCLEETRSELVLG